MPNLGLTDHKIRWIQQVFNSAYQEMVERGDGDQSFDIHGEFDRVYKAIWHTQRKLSLANTNFPTEDLAGLVVSCRGGANADVELVAPDSMDSNRFIVRLPSGRYSSYLKTMLPVPEDLQERLDSYRYGDD